MTTATKTLDIAKLKTPLERLRTHIEQANNAWLKLEFQRNGQAISQASKEDLAEWEHELRFNTRSAIQEISIDPDFRALIPPLSLGEKEQLKQNLLTEGVRDPLVVWRTRTHELFLLDGHNRRDVILAHGLLFDITIKEFTGRGQAHDWMINNQLGRRNLSSTQRSYLLGCYYNATKGQRGGDRKSKSEEPSLSRAEKIAEEQQVSPTQVKRAAKVAEAVDRLGDENPEVKAKVLAGEANVTQGQLVELATAPDAEISAAAEAIANGEPLPEKPQQLDLVEYIESIPDDEQTSAFDEQSKPNHTLSVLTSSKSVEHSSPQDLFDVLNAEFRFYLDVCATAQNAKCPYYFTEADDGLAQDWASSSQAPLDESGKRHPIWMNPPYGNSIGAWVEKAFWTAARDHVTVVCLLPANTDTRWWWDWCALGQVRLLPGRLKFGDAQQGAPFASAVVVFPGDMATNSRYRPSTEYWDPLGKRKVLLSPVGEWKNYVGCGSGIRIYNTVFHPINPVNPEISPTTRYELQKSERRK